jgi:hypothetical protein
MDELLRDVLGDLKVGRIDEAEALARVKRVVRACPMLPTLAVDPMPQRVVDPAETPTVYLLKKPIRGTNDYPPGPQVGDMPPYRETCGGNDSPNHINDAAAYYRQAQEMKTGKAE